MNTAALSDSLEYFTDRDMGVSKQGSIASLFDHFDQSRRDSEFSSQSMPTVFFEADSIGVRVNPFLREVERHKFYLCNLDNTEVPSWVLVSLIPQQSSHLFEVEKHGFIGEIKNVGSKLFRSFLPRTLPDVSRRKLDFKIFHEPRLELRDEDSTTIASLNEESVENSFCPSDDLVALILQSRKELLAEQDKVLDMLRNELDELEFAEIGASWYEGVSESIETRKDIRILIEQEIRLFIETVGSLSLGNTKARHFLLTKDKATKFLPSIENALLLPFHLTTDNKSLFLRRLVEELAPIAATGTLRTAHGKLTIQDFELVIERQEVESYDLFSPRTIYRHDVA